MAYDDHLEESFRAVREGEAYAIIGAYAQRIKIKIDRVRINLDPSHDVFNVEITAGNGEWRYTAGSEADLRIFLDGMRASIAMMGGHLEIPEIPIQSTFTITVSAQRSSKNR